jgi:hypothetical protein
LKNHYVVALITAISIMDNQTMQELHLVQSLLKKAVQTGRDSVIYMPTTSSEAVLKVLRRQQYRCEPYINGGVIIYTENIEINSSNEISIKESNGK